MPSRKDKRLEFDKALALSPGTLICYKGILYGEPEISEAIVLGRGKNLLKHCDKYWDSLVVCLFDTKAKGHLCDLDGTIQPDWRIIHRNHYHVFAIYVLCTYATG